MANFVMLVKKFPSNRSKQVVVNFDNIEIIAELGEGLATFHFKSGETGVFVFSLTDMEKLVNEDANKRSTDAV